MHTIIHGVICLTAGYAHAVLLVSMPVYTIAVGLGRWKPPESRRQEPSRRPLFWMGAVGFLLDLACLLFVVFPNLRRHFGDAFDRGPLTGVPTRLVLFACFYAIAASCVLVAFLAARVVRARR